MPCVATLSFAIGHNMPPLREICKLCFRANPVGFIVPDKIWKDIIPSEYQSRVVCISCFTRLADEKLIPWDRKIHMSSGLRPRSTPGLKVFLLCFFLSLFGLVQFRVTLQGMYAIKSPTPADEKSNQLFKKSKGVGMVTQIIGTFTPQQTHFSPKKTPAASHLEPIERKNLSLQALARIEPLSHLAQDYGVSRKFLYQQAAKASDALDEAFASSVDDHKVLFYLPITKDWIRQLVLALILICHSSFRGVIEILEEVFDYHNLSLGTIHNIVSEAVQKAQQVNNTQDLSGIRVGAHDEIFQASKPVLVGMDARTTYCYLLAVEDHRDETTWGVHLLDLADQGLHPDYTTADGGRGLRAGQAAVWEDVPCHGDVFHAERDLGKLAFFLENRATGCSTIRQKLERKMERAKKRGRGQSLSRRLAYARQAEDQAIELAEDIRTLTDWMQNDILSSAGPDLQSRRELYDFVVEELRIRESLHSHRIMPVRSMLENHRDNLLAFVGVLDERFAEIAARFNVPLFLVHAICELQNLDENLPRYWQQQARLRKKLRGKFDFIKTAVCETLAETPRASSIVENLNSRLRNYFFLRRHIGDDYLHLLRFFLNHRRFQRSERSERPGKSPAELLNAQTHPHWLEMLGFERFSRN